MSSGMLDAWLASSASVPVVGRVGEEAGLSGALFTAGIAATGAGAAAGAGVGTGWLAADAVGVGVVGPSVAFSSSSTSFSAVWTMSAGGGGT